MTQSLHNWQYFLSPHTAWDAMYHDCEHATQSIELEQYIFLNEELGRKFINLFVAKARQGIKIFLILDAFGSAGFIGSPLIDELRSSGGRCVFYNMVRVWDVFRPWRWFPRTHVKSLLIDTTIAYAGGVCFAEEMRHWRDTQIRVTGPVVKQFRYNFDRAQRRMDRRHNERYVPCRVEREEFSYLQSAPLRSWSVIYRELIRAIRTAQHSIDITTPFFAPNRRFRTLLQYAARRGIIVRLLIPHYSDHYMIDWVCLSFARQLLRSGVKIYRFHKCTLHCKSVVIDQNWATVGSTNMDILSFFRNREANFVIKNIVAVKELHDQFVADLQYADELTTADLAQEPHWKFMLGYSMRMFKSFL